ncbi:hypothetical protein ACJX0J_012098 [Zea mays]
MSRIDLEGVGNSEDAFSSLIILCQFLDQPDLYMTTGTLSKKYIYDYCCKHYKTFQLGSLVQLLNYDCTFAWTNTWKEEEQPEGGNVLRYQGRWHKLDELGLLIFEKLICMLEDPDLPFFVPLGLVWELKSPSGLDEKLAIKIIAWAYAGIS